MKNVIGVILGIVVGMSIMMALHMASVVVYPLPEGVSLMSQEPENLEKLKAWFQDAPTGAWVLATLSHGLGCMAGAAVATLIAKRSLVPALIIGVFFTVGGVMNLQQIPHPDWFPYVDLPLYIVLAAIAGLMLRKKGEESAPSA
ncbi:MAG: hypothetical protein AAF517_04275 [Planctomycetota bacterium]